MQKLIVAFAIGWALLVGGGSDAPAQLVPGTVSFTARLYDEGTPVTGAHTFIVRLYDAPEGGGMLWSEIHPSLAVEDGLVHIALGGSTALDETIFAGGAVWLDVTIDGTLLTPRLPIRSVPYALRAGVAGRLGDLGPGDVAPVGHAHAGAYMPAVSTSCGAGNYVSGLNADGTPQCASLNAAIRDYVNQNCFIYYGWRDSCDGCTTAPGKWGRVNGTQDCQVPGVNGNCTDYNLNGVIVRMVGLNTDGDVNDDDKFYVGLKCF